MSNHIKPLPLPLKQNILQQNFEPQQNLRSSPGQKINISSDESVKIQKHSKSRSSPLRQQQPSQRSLTPQIQFDVFDLKSQMLAKKNQFTAKSRGAVFSEDVQQEIDASQIIFGSDYCQEEITGKQLLKDRLNILKTNIDMMLGSDTFDPLFDDDANQESLLMLNSAVVEGDRFYVSNYVKNDDEICPVGIQMSDVEMYILAFDGALEFLRDKDADCKLISVLQQTKNYFLSKMQGKATAQKANQSANRILDQMLVQATENNEKLTQHVAFQSGLLTEATRKNKVYQEEIRQLEEEIITKNQRISLLEQAVFNQHSKLLYFDEQMRVLNQQLSDQFIRSKKMSAQVVSLQRSVDKLTERANLAEQNYAVETQHRKTAETAAMRYKLLHQQVQFNYDDLKQQYERFQEVMMRERSKYQMQVIDLQQKQLLCGMNPDSMQLNVNVKAAAAAIIRMSNMTLEQLLHLGFQYDEVVSFGYLISASATSKQAQHFLDMVHFDHDYYVPKQTQTRSVMIAQLNVQNKLFKEGQGDYSRSRSQMDSPRKVTNPVSRQSSRIIVMRQGSHTRLLGEQNAGIGAGIDFHAPYLGHTLTGLQQETETSYVDQPLSKSPRKGKSKKSQSGGPKQKPLNQMRAYSTQHGSIDGQVSSIRQLEKRTDQKIHHSMSKLDLLKQKNDYLISSGKEFEEFNGNKNNQGKLDAHDLQALRHSGEKLIQSLIMDSNDELKERLTSTLSRPESLQSSDLSENNGKQYRQTYQQMRSKSQLTARQKYQNSKQLTLQQQTNQSYHEKNSYNLDACHQRSSGKYFMDEDIHNQDQTSQDSTQQMLPLQRVKSQNSYRQSILSQQSKMLNTTNVNLQQLSENYLLSGSKANKSPQQIVEFMQRIAQNTGLTLIKELQVQNNTSHYKQSQQVANTQQTIKNAVMVSKIQPHLEIQKTENVQQDQLFHKNDVSKYKISSAFIDDGQKVSQQPIEQMLFTEEQQHIVSVDEFERPNQQLSAEQQMYQQNLNSALKSLDLMDQMVSAPIYNSKLEVVGYLDKNGVYQKYSNQVSDKYKSSLISQLFNNDNSSQKQEVPPKSGLGQQNKNNSNKIKCYQQSVNQQQQDSMINETLQELNINQLLVGDKIQIAENSKAHIARSGDDIQQIDDNNIVFSSSLHPDEVSQKLKQQPFPFSNTKCNVTQNTKHSMQQQQSSSLQALPKSIMQSAAKFEALISKADNQVSSQAVLNKYELSVSDNVEIAKIDVQQELVDNVDKTTDQYREPLPFDELGAHGMSLSQKSLNQIQNPQIQGIGVDNCEQQVYKAAFEAQCKTEVLNNSSFSILHHEVADQPVSAVQATLSPSKQVQPFKTEEQVILQHINNSESLLGLAVVKPVNVLFKIDNACKQLLKKLKMDEERSSSSITACEQDSCEEEEELKPHQIPVKLHQITVLENAVFHHAHKIQGTKLDKTLKLLYDLPTKKAITRKQIGETKAKYIMTLDEFMLIFKLENSNNPLVVTSSKILPHPLIRTTNDIFFNVTQFSDFFEEGVFQQPTYTQSIEFLFNLNKSNGLFSPSLLGQTQHVNPKVLRKNTELLYFNMKDEKSKQSLVISSLIPQPNEVIVGIRLSACSLNKSTFRIFQQIEKIFEISLVTVTVYEQQYIRVPISSRLRSNAWLLKTINLLLDFRSKADNAYLVQSEVEAELGFENEITDKVNEKHVFSKLSGSLNQEPYLNLSDLLILFARTRYGLDNLALPLIFDFIVALVRHQFESQLAYLFARFFFVDFPPDYLLLFLELCKKFNVSFINKIGILKEEPPSDYQVQVDRIPYVLTALFKNWDVSRTYAIVDLLQQEFNYDYNQHEATTSLFQIIPKIFSAYSLFRRISYQNSLLIFNYLASQEQLKDAISIRQFRRLLELSQINYKQVQQNEFYFAFTRAVESLHLECVLDSRLLTQEQFRSLFVVCQFGRFATFSTLVLHGFVETRIQRQVMALRQMFIKAEDLVQVTSRSVQDEEKATARAEKLLAIGLSDVYQFDYAAGVKKLQQLLTILMEMLGRSIQGSELLFADLMLKGIGDMLEY